MCWMVVGLAKGGLTRHRRRCEIRLGLVEGSQQPPKRMCKAAKKPCPDCGKELEAGNIQRHLRGGACRGGGASSIAAQKQSQGEVEESQQPPASVNKAAKNPCPECGKELTPTNIQRHLRETCQGGEASGAAAGAASSIIEIIKIT